MFSRAGTSARHGAQAGKPAVAVSVTVWAARRSTIPAKTRLLGTAGRAYDQRMERESRRRFVRVTQGPPENELPAVVAAGISWSGAGVVFAVPALLVYSTGFELLIMFRSEWKQVETGEDLSDPLGRRWHAHEAMLHMRDIGEKLHGLRVNGRSVTQLGQHFNDHGFDGRGWVSAGTLAVGDQVLTLDWAGIESDGRVVPRAAFVDALPQVTALWAHA